MSSMMIKGAIDRLSNDCAIGWLYNADYTAPPLVRAFLYHDLIGEGFADTYRPDLEEIGFGDGCYGFEIRFNRAIDREHLKFVTIKPENVDLHLPTASGSAAYSDLVSRVFRENSSAGRTRSVLGGLWTDRMDSSQLLIGRVAVGACPAELEPPLQELIGNGYVVLHNALAPNGISERDIANIKVATEPNSPDDEGSIKLRGVLTTVGSLLFRDPIVRLLRAVFDDHPVIYKLESIDEESIFAQASTFEALPSPAECLAIYMGHPHAMVRLDLLRDSHELPEFGTSGRSRWTSSGAEELSQFALTAEHSVESIELDALDVAIVSPGMAHRAVITPEAPALRAVVAPRRVTPTCFLNSKQTWVEVVHVSGGRIRIK